MRGFYLGLCFAFVLVVSFQIFFSSAEITRQVRAIVDRQKQQYDIRFREASLHLMHGAIPQLAIELEDVSFSTQRVCPGMAFTGDNAIAVSDASGQAPAGAAPTSDSAVRMARLRVPFRVWRLLMGHVEAGEVEAEDVMIDLDRLKSPCREGTVAARREEAVSRAAAELVPAKPWWTDAQLESLRAILRGVNFHRVDLRFETRRDAGKQVRLEDFSLRLNDPGAPKRIHVSSYLRIPETLTYGELLPPFAIEADANPNSAEVNVKADLSEGSLESFAQLHPSQNGGLKIEAKASVSDLPLSTTMPLFTKSGIVQKKLKPKFLWLNCGVSIQGEFQGLLETQPLFFERCSIEGNGAQIRLNSATRQPNGRWAPFEVEVRHLDLRRIFETFDAKGPEGIASDYGRITGHFKFENPEKIQFGGVLEGAAVHFSNRNLRAIQTVSKMSAEVELRGHEMHAKIHSIELLHGNFKGQLDLEGDSEFRKARVKLQVDDLTLDPSVQRLLVNGDLSAAKGQGEALIRDGRLASVAGDWFLNSLDGRDFKLRLARLQTSYQNGIFNLQLHAPLLLLNQTSDFFAPLKGIFFDHRFDDAWLKLRAVTMHASISESLGLEWDHAGGSTADEQIVITTGGRWTREENLDGWLALDYPLVKKLRWDLLGELSKPEIKEQSKTLLDLHKKGPVTDRALGLREERAETR